MKLLALVLFASSPAFAFDYHHLAFSCTGTATKTLTVKTDSDDSGVQALLDATASDGAASGSRLSGFNIISVSRIKQLKVDMLKERKLRNQHWTDTLVIEINDQASNTHLSITCDPAARETCTGALGEGSAAEALTCNLIKK